MLRISTRIHCKCKVCTDLLFPVVLVMSLFSASGRTMLAFDELVSIRFIWWSSCNCFEVAKMRISASGQALRSLRAHAQHFASLRCNVIIDMHHGSNVIDVLLFRAGLLSCFLNCYLTCIKVNNFVLISLSKFYDHIKWFAHNRIHMGDIKCCGHALWLSGLGNDSLWLPSGSE